MEGMWRALQPPTFQYTDLVDACGASRFAQLETVAKFTEVGRLFMLGYEKTLVGQALIAVLRVLGPKRMLDRMTRNFRTANNYTEVVVEAVTATQHTVRITHVTRPGLFIGLLEKGLTYAGAKNLSVKLIDHHDTVARYDVRWAE